MTKPHGNLGLMLRKPRFTFNQALFLFAIPVAVWMFVKSRKRDAEILAGLVGTRRQLDAPIIVLTPEGERVVTVFEDYVQVVLAIPLPDAAPRQTEGFAAARGMLLIAWMEIASERSLNHSVELGRFSALAALDAAIEAHPNYKTRPVGFAGRSWGFAARLQSFVNLATPDLLSSLSRASGYTTQELQESAIVSLAAMRNVTGHCKEHKATTRSTSARIDMRPLYLVSAMLCELGSPQAP